MNHENDVQKIAIDLSTHREHKCWVYVARYKVGRLYTHPTTSSLHRIQNFMNKNTDRLRIEAETNYLWIGWSWS